MFFTYAGTRGRGLEIFDSVDLVAFVGRCGWSAIFRPQSHVFGPRITFNIAIIRRTRGGWLFGELVWGG